MATYGTVTTNVPSVYTQRQIVFQWYQQSQDANNNRTTISWTLKGGGSSTSGIRCSQFKVKISGVEAYYSDAVVTLYNDTGISSGTWTIYHDSTGAASMSVYVEGAIGQTDGSYVVNSFASETFQLETIDRNVTVTQEILARTETTVRIQWRSNKVCDRVWYSIDDGATWSNPLSYSADTGWFDIAETLYPGAVYPIKVRVRAAASGYIVQSAAMLVRMYDYPYCADMPTFYIGSPFTLTIYNPMGRTVAVTFIADDDTEILPSYTTQGTSLAWTVTSAFSTALYNSIPTKSTGVYKIKCVYTDAGGVTHTDTRGSATSLYNIVANDCLPIIGTVAYEDTNSTVIALTQNNQDIVRNRSLVRYSASGISALHGATITGVSVTVNGNTHALTYAQGSATGGTWTINSASNVEAVFAATDSRGTTVTKSIEITIINWTAPTAIIALSRHDNFYTATDIRVDASYASINGNNQIHKTLLKQQRGFFPLWDETDSLPI